MAEKAFDIFGRTVFFKSMAEDGARDSFYARGIDGIWHHYHTRHRTDGPAIISPLGNMWFMDGENYTHEVNNTLIINEDVYFVDDDFALCSAGVLAMKMISM